MPPRDLRAYLFDVAEACRLVEEFTRGKSAADYAGDSLLRSGVERQLEIVGEALNQALRNHPSELADRMPKRPESSRSGISSRMAMPAWPTISCGGSSSRTCRSSVSASTCFCGS
jgi:hypothetical protein